MCFGEAGIQEGPEQLQIMPLKVGQNSGYLWSQVSAVCFALKTMTQDGAYYQQAFLQRHDRQNK